MEDERFISYCIDAVNYILDNKRITDKECEEKFGKYYGDMVFNELVRLKVGNQVGYGPVEKNKNTHSFIEYFNKRMENIKQKKADAALDRESKWTSIKYTKRAYIISIIAILLSVISIVVSSL
jgi:hypothetical protein